MFFILFLYCFSDLDKPVLTVHQTISDVRGSYYQEKTVFLRCTVNSNPPARFIWKRGSMLIEQSKDNGVDIYEPLYTQVHRNTYKEQTLYQMCSHQSLSAPKYHRKFCRPIYIILNSSIVSLTRNLSPDI